MNMFEEAKSLKGMLGMREMTQSRLAEMLGVSQPYIANKLRLLGFSEDLQQRIIESGISERHARTLLRLPDELREVGLSRVSEGRMTVAQTEIMTDCMLEEKGLEDKPCTINAAQRISRFERLLDTSVKNLRLFGITAHVKRDQYLGKIYITVCIE